ncbi:patched domain-containing protein 3-like [Teleopsis dalmanni]|uniref:patched domain-containing protein 3-like n=1 Tax=Teleopsis dalmanni TaxID=139649 RepID=UPI0018CE64C5|nr:patched domain-containing protein 3-like [Teleopsis dalmanni]
MVPNTSYCDTSHCLKRYSESEQRKIQRLLSEVELGDRRPTQLLTELTALAKDKVSDEFLKSLWLKRLPPQVRAILQASNVALAELAKLADRICEAGDFQQIAVASASDCPAYSENAVILRRLEQIEQRLSRLDLRRMDRARAPLEQPYEGPFEVLSRSEKTSVIVCRGREVTVSNDRLKAAYLTCDDLEQVVPETRQPSALLNGDQLVTSGDYVAIDDTFVMLAAWRRTPAKMPVAERMGHMMSEAAVSITITSLTDMISFSIGIISPFRSVQIFCTYCGFAVCFTFLWHCTFFAACMAISGYREHRNLHAIFGCKVQALSVAIKEKRNFLYKAIMAGGINHDDPDNPIDNKDHMFMAFFKDNLASVINNKWCKMLIILIFAAYLGGACYGITQIKEGLERRKLSSADSYSVEFFDREDDYYREFPYRMQVIITGDLNYSDPMVQYQIEELTRNLENTSYVFSSLYTESWIRSFLSFVDRNNDYLNLTIESEQDFIDAVKEHWLFPGNPFSLDVKFNENDTRIIASRFLIQAVNITDTNHEKEMVRDLRKICKDSPLNASIFHPYFVFFDQFELVRPTSLQAMIIGAIIMMIISYIFIPNILCSLWVAFSVISIELGVAGYMALWDIRGRFGRVIVIPKDGNDNMIRREIFKELRQLDDIIQNATVHFEGDAFTYKDACARWENECFSNDILNLDFIMDDIESGELNLTFPLMFNPVTWDAHAFPVFFGGTKLTEDNIIISVPAIQLVYFVAADTKRQDAKGAEWEETFLTVVGKAEDSGMFKHISVAYFASRTLDHELEKNTKTVVPYFGSTFILISFFSILTCMMGDAVRSKPWLGMMGNISAVMSTCAAFGFAMYLGIEFIGINLAAPFLIISK